MAKERRFPERFDHGTYEGYVLGLNRGKALPLDKVIRLLEATKEIKDPDYDGYEANFYYVLVGLGLYAGCRVGEAAARKWEDINWDEGPLFSAISSGCGRWVEDGDVACL